MGPHYSASFGSRFRGESYGASFAITVHDINVNEPIEGSSIVLQQVYGRMEFEPGMHHFWEAIG